MSAALAASCWPTARLGEALQAVASEGGLRPAPRDPPAPPPGLLQAGDPALSTWLDAVAAGLELETEPVVAPAGDLEELLRHAGPALLRLPEDGLRTDRSSSPGSPGQPPPEASDAEEPSDTGRFVALVRSRRRDLVLLGPDLRQRRVPARRVAELLRADLTAPHAAAIERLLAEAGVPGSRRARLRELVVREHVGHESVRRCWLLRHQPGSSFVRQMSGLGLIGRGLGFVGLHLISYLLMLLAWWLVGRSALQGHFDPSWLAAWALILLSLVPLSAAASWWQGVFGIGVSGLLQRRLMLGALSLQPDEIRHEGAGQLLARVTESLGLTGAVLQAGFAALMAVVDLAVAGGVLALGAGGWLHPLLLLGWCVASVVVGLAYMRRRVRWTDWRLRMTHDLVEQMVGHRTRLAQQPPERWHDGEDQALEEYLHRSRQLDRSSVQLGTLLSRGWMVVGLAGLALPFVRGSSPGVGGVLLASQALSALSGSLASMSLALIAWRQARPLYRAAARHPSAAAPAEALALGPSSRDGADGRPAPVLAAHDLRFTYSARVRPVVDGCSLEIRPGERVLLEGPSGGGKSTLIALLAGLRRPQGGLLLLHGLDLPTVGAQGWRRRIASAPQFHDNHVLTETLSFNLLMGRGWPPRPEDLAEAQHICHELGLGELLERMPAGLQQTVGESGWRLSHGERSRVFIARALLQDPDLVILDESFAALDPETLGVAMECVLRRARALLLIAHP